MSFSAIPCITVTAPMTNAELIGMMAVIFVDMAVRRMLRLLALMPAFLPNFVRHILEHQDAGQDTAGQKDIDDPYAQSND